MGGRSTRAGGSKKVGMEIVKFDHHANKVKEEESPPPLPPPPHLSGAYIRSLVKQLTSSRNKDVPAPDVDGVYDNNGDGFGEEALVIEDGSCCQQSPIQPQASDQALVQQQQQQHKKQVRRRLHTTRPYQERLLNMAEARREIVTALKFHRASMKQSTEQHHRQPTPPPPVQPQMLQPSLQPPPQSSSFRGRTKCRRNRRVYPSTSASCVESNFSYHPAFGSSSSSSLISQNSSYCWPSNSHEIPPPHPAITGNLMNLGLPNQRPLGLNLNIHDFTNFEATLYHHNPSSFSTSPSPIPNNNLEAISKQQQQQQQGNSSEIVDPNSSTGNGGGMQQHQGKDEEEIMSEMEWMGEQHQMEWNDTMNLVTSAWWFKFFKTAGEIGPKYKGDGDGNNDDKEDDPFDQAVVEFPDWLNTANDQSCFHHCLDESSQDPALPW